MSGMTPSSRVSAGRGTAVQTGAERADVTFVSAGVDCAAWVYQPGASSLADRETGAVPVVVMAHGLSGVREQRLDAYAERFSDAGVGAVVFDYRHFGASSGHPRQLLDVGRQLEDWRNAIAYARSLPWADPDRIALFGSSFSGGHALKIAAADARIAAVVSQCPYTDPLGSAPKLPWSSAIKAGIAGIRDELRALAGKEPFYIPASGRAGEAAMMASPDSNSGMAALTPEGSSWENRVAARIALRINLYRPGPAAARVRCPLLLCACDADTVASAPVARRHISKAPLAEIKNYPFGHFDIYVGEPFEQAVSDQTEFLTRTLCKS